MITLIVRCVRVSSYNLFARNALRDLFRFAVSFIIPSMQSPSRWDPPISRFTFLFLHFAMTSSLKWDRTTKPRRRSSLSLRRAVRAYRTDTIVGNSIIFAEKWESIPTGSSTWGFRCHPRYYFGSLAADIARLARSSCHDGRNFIEPGRARLLFFCCRPLLHASDNVRQGTRDPTIRIVVARGKKNENAGTTSPAARHRRVGPHRAFHSSQTMRRAFHPVNSRGLSPLARKSTSGMERDGVRERYRASARVNAVLDGLDITPNDGVP